MKQKKLYNQGEIHTVDIPMISVLMSIYREPKFMLNEAIVSILNQTYENIEFIIMVDDPSNIEAIELISEYKDTRIKMYVNDHNLGLVKSLNRGLQYCCGDYIARMDADDVAELDRLENEMFLLNKDKLDIVGTSIRAFDADIRTGKKIICPMYHKYIVKAMRVDNAVKHPTWLVKKNVYDTLEGYRDIPTCEDYDFLIRAILMGYRLGNVRKIGLNYRYRKQSISRSNELKQHEIVRYLRQCFNKKRIPSEKELKNYIDSKSATEHMEKRKNFILNKKKKRVLNVIFNLECYKLIIEKLWYASIILRDKYVA